MDDEAGNNEEISEEDDENEERVETAKRDTSAAKTMLVKTRTVEMVVKTRTVEMRPVTMVK